MRQPLPPVPLTVWWRRKGTNMRDIAVVVGQIKDYEQALAREFHRLNIPFFMDYKKSMGANALAEYVLALLGMYKKYGL